MKNFRINNPDDPAPTVESKAYDVGTRFTFRNMGGRIQAAISIPVLIVT
jgi:hypothetical protein